MHARRSQSAMEYLMTYGWAILIIAVVLGVIFSLGVFNPTNYAPKASTSSCHVFRPNGPGTNFGAVLVGTCSGFLPQYVGLYNGHTSFMNATGTPMLMTGGSVSVVAWVYFAPSQTSSRAEIVGRGPEDTTGYYDLFYMNSMNLAFRVFSASGSTQTPYLTPQTRAWHFVAGTLDSSTGNLTLYLDGAHASASNAVLAPATSGGIVVGAFSCDCDPFNGSIANVQIYNASLDANEITYLYNEGIGGAPVYLKHLVAWWPLNGDAKDYSGNGNNARLYNLTYNGSWYPGYNAP